METDYINNIDGEERRFFAAPVECRAENDEQFLEGTAVVFNSPADLRAFTEEIDVRAFDEVWEGSDVRALFNHDPNIVLGRRNAGTLELRKTEKGITYRVKYNPNDPDHVRVMEKVKRGDVSQSSFSFRVAKDEWTTRNGKDHRKIMKLERWGDVSPVTYPGYPDTKVAARSLDQVKQEENQNKPKTGLSYHEARVRVLSYI